MSWKRIGDLVRLRYKLMWAKTQSRNGEIALFVIGYLLFVMVAAPVALGRVGAGMVVIITKPGKLVWQGDITVLAHDGAVQCDDREFDSLEDLFLHLTGEKYADLNWL